MISDHYVNKQTNIISNAKFSIDFVVVKRFKCSLVMERDTYIPSVPFPLKVSITQLIRSCTLVCVVHMM